MYSAFVKLINNLGQLSLSQEDRQHVRIHPKDSYCALVSHVRILNNKDGSEVNSTVIQANQTVRIEPAIEINPLKYHLLTAYNAELTELGALVVPYAVLTRPNSGQKIGLLVRPTKKLDISELSHIFELYLIG